MHKTERLKREKETLTRAREGGRGVPFVWIRRYINQLSTKSFGVLNATYSGSQKRNFLSGIQLFISNESDRTDHLIESQGYSLEVIGLTADKSLALCVLNREQSRRK